MFFPRSWRSEETHSHGVIDHLLSLLLLPLLGHVLRVHGLQHEVVWVRLELNKAGVSLCPDTTPVVLIVEILNS